MGKIFYALENLLKHIGWRNKRCGFTLIEIVIVLTIQMIFISISYKVVSNLNLSYKNLRDIAIQEDNYDDSFLNIDRLLKSMMLKDIIIKESNSSSRGEISIFIKENHKLDKIIKKVIRLDSVGNKIILETFNENTRLGVNILMRNVEDLNIIKKGKLNYIKVKTLDGEEKVQCM